MRSGSGARTRPSSIASGARVVVIGSANVDLVARVDSLPREGETVFAHSVFRACGGKGANQAVAAARLGARVAFAGCVGDDADGELQREALVRDGVDVDALLITDLATGTAMIVVDGDGANTIVVAAGANARCSTVMVDRVLAAKPGVLIVQHEIPSDIVGYALLEAKRRGYRTILNPAPARAIDPDVLRAVDYLTPNASEAAALTRLPVTDDAGAEEAAAQLLAAGATEVIITLGAYGALHASASATRAIGSFRVDAVDTTGAGDAYTGAFAAALADDRPVEEALVFAAAAAALAVTKPGAQSALPTRLDVEMLLDRRAGGVIR